MWRIACYTQNFQELAGSSKLDRQLVHALSMLSLQSCLTLCDPMDCSPPGSPVRGILQARILEWVAMPSSRGSSWPRDRTGISYVCSLVILAAIPGSTIGTLKLPDTVLATKQSGGDTGGLCLYLLQGSLQGQGSPLVHVLHSQTLPDLS